VRLLLDPIPHSRLSRHLPLKGLKHSAVESPNLAVFRNVKHPNKEFTLVFVLGLKIRLPSDDQIYP